jgi:hypothetical protein
MDATLISGAILSALSAVQALLPLLGVAGNTASIVTTIITALTKIVPLLEMLAPIVGDEVSLVYQGVKNIIANLRSDGVVTTAQQDADLDALDLRVDTAWNKILPQFDPDYVPPASPATS